MVRTVPEHLHGPARPTVPGPAGRPVHPAFARAEPAGRQRLRTPDGGDAQAYSSSSFLFFSASAMTFWATLLGTTS
jgi:hypothetical protein